GSSVAATARIRSVRVPISPAGLKAGRCALRRKRKAVRPPDETLGKVARRQEPRRSRNTRATRTRVPSAADRCRKTRRANDSIAPRMDNATRGHGGGFDPCASWPRSFGWRFVAVFRAEPQIVDEQSK